jgi:hypothetical protein
MGQYFIVVNMTKKEYLYPHAFNDGLKATEFGSGRRTLSALHVLLTKSSGGGGGDYQDDPTGMIGSWAGDRIWIVGDYDKSKLYDKAQKSYTDISNKIIPILKDAYPWDWKSNCMFGD